MKRDDHGTSKKGVEGKTSPKPLTSEGTNLKGKLLEVRSRKVASG